MKNRRFYNLALVALLVFASVAKAAVSFDHAADLGNNGGTTSTLSGAFTVNSGDSILMVVAMGDAVAAAGGSGRDDTSVTDNGVAMTLAGKILNSQDCWEYLFYSLNPVTGSHTIVANATVAHCLKLGAASYEGVVGVGASTTHSGTGTSLTTSLTTQANSWIFIAEDAYSGSSAPTAGSGDVRRSYEGTYGTWGIFDSNAALSSGAHSFTTNVTQNVAITHIALELTTSSSSGSTITFDHGADLGNNNGTTSSLSGTFAVNSGDTILMVVAMGDAVPAAGGNGVDDTTVTDNGVGMSLAGKILNSQDCWEYLFYSLNPATGSHTIVAHAGSAHWLKLGAASYKGVVGIGASTTHSGTGTSLTTSLMTGHANSWVFIAEDAYSGGGPGTAGAGDVRRSYEAAFGTWGIYDSNAALATAGTYSFTTHRSSSVVITHIAVELTATGGGVSTPITFDHAVDLGNNGGATSSLSGTFTVNSGDTILMVVAMGDGVPGTGGNSVDDTTVTDNGVGMTLAGKTLNSQDCWEYLFYSLSPATGSHTI